MALTPRNPSGATPMAVNGISVDYDGSADDVCILVEANLPRVVAEDRDGRTAGRADFSGQKETALDRLETESSQSNPMSQVVQIDARIRRFQSG